MFSSQKESGFFCFGKKDGCISDLIVFVHLYMQESVRG